MPCVACAYRIGVSAGDEGAGGAHKNCPTLFARANLWSSSENRAHVFSFSFPPPSLNHTPRTLQWVEVRTRCFASPRPSARWWEGARHQTQHGTTALTTRGSPIRSSSFSGNAQKSAIARAKNAEKAKAAGKGE